MIDRWFLDHPRSVGESYFAHQRKALSFSGSLFAAGGACLIHALVPALFKCTGSRTVALLHESMTLNRFRRSEVADTARADSGAPPNDIHHSP